MTNYYTEENRVPTKRFILIRINELPPLAHSAICEPHSTTGNNVGGTSGSGSRNGGGERD